MVVGRSAVYTCRQTFSGFRLFLLLFFFSCLPSFLPSSSIPSASLTSLLSASLSFASFPSYLIGFCFFLCFFLSISLSLASIPSACLPSASLSLASTPASLPFASLPLASLFSFSSLSLSSFCFFPSAFLSFFLSFFLSSATILSFSQYHQSPESGRQSQIFLPINELFFNLVNFDLFSLINHYLICSPMKIYLCPSCSKSVENHSEYDIFSCYDTFSFSLTTSNSE